LGRWNPGDGDEPPSRNPAQETVVTAPQPADLSTNPDASGGARRRWPIVVILVGAVLLAGAWLGFSYLFLRPAAPAAVGLSSASPSAVAAAPSATASSGAAASADPSAAATDAGAGTSEGGLDGTWNVDPTIGSFDDFSGSFVGYRVEEELANIGAATAVGRTPDVTGTFTFDGTTVSAAEFTADLTTLQSDSNQRDGQLRRQALETGTYPTATFKLTQPIDLGSLPADGEVVKVTATGDLTIHGQTQSVQIPLEARLAGDVVTVTGSTEIVFADYGMNRPQSFMVLSIADRGTMEFQLQLTKA
jgi:polyisoprenoid-binding protein YceI